MSNAKLIAACAAALGLTVFAINDALAAQRGNSKLGQRDEELVQQAEQAGKSRLVLIVAATKGSINQAVADISALGGQIQFRDDTLGYLRVSVAVGQVKALAALASVQGVDVDETVPLPDPRPDPEGSAGVNPQVAPSAATPRNNPYLPIGDTGAAQFTATHPTWDGRGVTIGVVDAGITLDHPSLLTTSTGERKIVDWVTGTDPFTDNDPTWLDMSNQVSGAQFTFQGRTYTAPANGSYRIALFNERDPRLGGEVGSDVNRDGNPAGSSGLFAVLWDPGPKDLVWVDTNQNGSFADEVAMTDYKVKFDVNYFGVDNPATPVAERMPFVVQTDGKLKVVNIGIPSSAHASHVAGIASGNALFGGAMSGAAPGAKLVSVRACLFIAGCTNHALVEGMIYAVKSAHVDVINMSIGGLPALNDGNNARAEIYNRLIDQYKVQLFFSAGNDGPGMNTVGDPSVATNVVSVGSYLSRATMQLDYGADTPFTDNLHAFTSNGPREDGGFKPEIVAPGAAVSTTPMWQNGVGLPYALPPGYQLMNGTSMAAPQATGAAALLISAARQTNVQFKPDQLRQAIRSSTRLLDSSRLGVYRQGNGIVQTEAAWNLLKTNISTDEIVARVPVNTVLSSFLAEPGVGVGIYDREGVVVGQSYTRTYTIMRTKGGSQPKTYTVSWVGGDGTFSSPGTIALPLNVAVNLPVTINPATAGAHSAIMNLDSPGAAGIEFQTMNVVDAADTFSAGNNFSVTKSGQIGRAQQLTHFVRVPAGVPALKVDFSGPTTAANTGQARFLRWHPYGVGIDSNAVSNCYQPPQLPTTCSTGSATSRVTGSPLAGVWEITVDARRSSDTDFADYTMTASILGAIVSPNPDVIASATIGAPIARSYTITNLFGAFTGRAVGTTLGSANRGTPTIANAAQQQFQVNVAPGSTSLRATIGSTSDPAADLDLFVFNCTTGTCVQAGSSADGDSEESVTIANPAAGIWVVLVDGFAVPAGTTSFNYIDVFVNPAFGSVAVTDANALRAAGASWTVPGSVTANAAPAAGRVLFGNVRVVTDTNLQVGSGDVIVQSVQ
ncbi:MAG TPA: S8 family serine peptidase [Steroidobacteraceae bacterium]|nr:S8 family serine peptidase [Steroidobacteraceae bacterium]